MSKDIEKVQKKDNKNPKLVKAITSMDEDFAKWYANEWNKIVEKKMAEIEAMSN